MNSGACGQRGCGGRLRLVVALVSALTATACDDAQPAPCTQPGLGSGACCTLTLPDGRGLEGVCLQGRCRHAEQPGFEQPCGPMPGPSDGDVDADRTPDAPVDARPSDAGSPDRDVVDAAADAVADAVADVLVDGPPDPCARVICDPGERCVPGTGTCRSIRAGIPGGACEADADCQAGRCLSEQASGGAVPGGYCAVPCVDNGDCAGGHCLDAEGGRRCFESCDDIGTCRPGWTCVEPARPGCRIDCRHVGCPGQGVCDPDTGGCSPPPTPCRYPCAVGESCEEARCVRLDGSCATAYHCARGARCLRGRCAAEEFSACDADEACGPGQRCAGLAEAGVCLADCRTDDDCPADRACRPDLGACYYTVCGPGTENGALLGPCGFGSDRSREGTCLPFADSGDGPGDAPGHCVEAGLSAVGEPCDAQVEGRTAADRALRCAPGALCYDDPDDPRHPERDWARRGRCAALCAPGEPCADGQCVDFGSPDDPATPADEAVTLGLCLDVQCRALGQPACGPGERCRPFTLLDDAGRCGPAGAAAAGQPCADVQDCAEAALCVSRGAGTACLTLCDPTDGQACGEGRCYADVGWAFGVCL